MKAELFYPLFLVFQFAPLYTRQVRLPVVMIGITSITLVLLFFIQGGSDIVWLLSNLAGVVLLGTFTSWQLKLRYGTKAKTQSDEKERWELVKSRHSQLKTEVAQIENNEAMSLQIYATSKNLAEALSWKDMAPRLTSGIQKIFGAYEFLIFTVQETGEPASLLRRGAWQGEPPIKLPLPPETTLFSANETSEVVPVLYVPIYGGDTGDVLTGALFMKCPTKGKNEAELKEVGTEFGAQLALTISKAALFTQMEASSKLDGLTGICRRQAFMERFNEELRKSHVFKTPLSLMMVDIDHFKAVNDTHGHAGGDAVLKRVADLLKESVYETDVVGRYGGEEFIILLPKAQVDGVLRKAESLRARIERDVIASGFEKLSVTVSVGLAHFPSNGATAEDLIHAADTALYKAKESGRNRVVQA